MRSGSPDLVNVYRPPPAHSSLKVTLTKDPTLVSAGGDGVLSYGATIISVSSQFKDEAGNQMASPPGGDAFIEVATS